MKTVRFLQPAEEELFDAANYYEVHSSGLGEEFLKKIGSAILDISEYPERWPLIHPNIRRRLVHRFPYAILYRVDAHEVVILAVSHLHRHPTYWLKRI
jgi:plasmid stabilization system protein ParE